VSDVHFFPDENFEGFFYPKTGELFGALGPLFSPVQQKAKKIPKKSASRTKRTFHHHDESVVNSYEKNNHSRNKK
jgi:hypothetical protein